MNKRVVTGGNTGPEPFGDCELTEERAALELRDATAEVLRAARERRTPTDQEAATVEFYTPTYRGVSHRAWEACGLDVPKVLRDAVGAAHILIAKLNSSAPQHAEIELAAEALILAIDRASRAARTRDGLEH